MLAPRVARRSDERISDHERLLIGAESLVIADPLVTPAPAGRPAREHLGSGIRFYASAPC
jgi:hypothetical protein